MQITGILLAAGHGKRYHGGARNKLLEQVDGEAIVARAARTLLSVLPDVIAAVRSGDGRTAALLEQAGCRVVTVAAENDGVSASLRSALSAAHNADAWVIALGDMPWVKAGTVRALGDALHSGARIAAPVLAGRRGNPVAFHRTHLSELMQLRGDQGARRLLSTHPVTLVDVDDAGILRDVDTPADLNQ